jgi:hypothetical protein
MLAELDLVLQAQLLRRPARLREVVRIHVDRQHRRAAPGQLEAVEAGVAADVQHAPAAAGPAARARICCHLKVGKSPPRK